MKWRSRFLLNFHFILFYGQALVENCIKFRELAFKTLRRRLEKSLVFNAVC